MYKVTTMTDQDVEYLDNLYKVSRDGRLLKYINKQTDELCLAAVNDYTFALEFVINQTVEICLAAVRKNGLALQHVKEQIDEICSEAIKNEFCAIHYVKKQTKQLCLQAINMNGYAIRYIRDQTPDLCLAAVSAKFQVFLPLEYIKKNNQTPEICLAAVKHNGMSLEYVAEPTYEIYMEAVKKIGSAVRFLKNDAELSLEQKREICNTAIKQDKCAKQYISDKSILIVPTFVIDVGEL